MKILERDCKARKREAERGSGISPERIPRDRSDHGRLFERRDEEEAKQGKESAEDRNKEYEGDEGESHGAASSNEEEKWKR